MIFSDISADNKQAGCKHRGKSLHKKIEM